MCTATYISLRVWLGRVLVLQGLLISALGTSAWGVTVASISRSAKTPWVVDGTGVLDDETRAELNRLGSEVEQSGLGELVTVLVATTEGRPSRTFASELFNRWKLGHARRDDGVLLFVALLDRKAEIILGDGVDSPQDVARSEQVMRERIIPALKEGETGEAMLEGARGLRTLLAQSTINAGLKLRAKVRVESDTAQALPPARPGSQEARPPAPEPKEFLDDEGMYVDMRTSHASEEAGAPAATPQGQVPAPSSGTAAPSPGSDGGTRVTVQSSVPLWVWAVVGIFILFLLVANGRRRGRTRCDACGSTNVSVSTSSVFMATDGDDGLDQVTVRCLSCGYVDTFTRDVSARERSRRHDGTHGGGTSSGKGASGSW